MEKKWTKFFDLASGGSQKTKYSAIFIELPEYEAIEYFENKFGINPNNTTCECCGVDFSIYEVDKPEHSEFNKVISKDKL